MTEMTLEKELRSFNYSVFSKVKDSLLKELLQRHDADNSRRVKGLSGMLASEMLTDDELDYVAAAGNPSIDNKKNF